MCLILLKLLSEEWVKKKTPQNSESHRFQISHRYTTPLLETRATIRFPLHPPMSPHGHLVCSYLQRCESYKKHQFWQVTKNVHFKEAHEQGANNDVDGIKMTQWNHESPLAHWVQKRYEVGWFECPTQTWISSCSIQDPQQQKSHPVPGNVRLVSIKKTVCITFLSSRTESWKLLDQWTHAMSQHQGGTVVICGMWVQWKATV